MKTIKTLILLITLLLILVSYVYWDKVCQEDNCTYQGEVVKW